VEVRRSIGEVKGACSGFVIEWPARAAVVIDGPRSAFLGGRSHRGETCTPMHDIGPSPGTIVMLAIGRVFVSGVVRLRHHPIGSPSNAIPTGRRLFGGAAPLAQ
jgi:hypothetical protein